MATYTFDKIDYGGNTYVVSDSGALQLTGGQVTGPVTFGDSVSIDEATLGDLVVNGSASFTNNIQANTINGVAVGSSPKFTDTPMTVTTTGSGNVISAISASGTTITATKGATVSTNWVNGSATNSVRTTGSAAEGSGYTIGTYAVAEGYGTEAKGNYSHAEGSGSQARGESSHAEGVGTTASGAFSHAEGQGTTASTGAHAEGVSTIASGQNSHAEGAGTETKGNYSHAEGTNTTTNNTAAHAEGADTTASGLASHAEGQSTVASNTASHAEGSSTTASGTLSHAEGDGATASGLASHAEGSNTIANHMAQHVFGVYNIADPSTASSTAPGNYVEIVGNGANNARSNARTLDWDGNEVLAGKLTVGVAGTNSMDVATVGQIPTVPSNIVNTITTTAGAHTAITSQKGNVSFNVPTTAAHVGAAESSHAHGNITNGGDITATAPTIASGDQIIINDHSASKITNGPTFDGSTTTTALTPKGTWETFAKSDTNTTYALSGALSSHKFTSTLTAGGSGSGTSTSDFTLAAGTGITITDDTSARKMTIACSVTNTDEKVKLTSQATSGTYPLIFGPTSITSNSTYQGYYNTGITVNPSTKTVTATTFVGALTGTASGNLTSSSTLDATKLSGTIPTSCYTDTKNTAGTTNKTGTKMFLVVATEQSANPTTYSNSNCYIGTDNCLYSGGTKVLTAHQTAVTSLTTTAGTHTTKSSATGAVSMTIPTKTSHLTNDSGFISTAAQIIRW